MLSVLGIVARCALVVGMAFLLGKTLPSMPNKVCRFAFLCVVCVPFCFVINYVNVQLLGYHRMGSTGNCIIAVLVATFGTFWPTESRNSNAS